MNATNEAASLTLRLQSPTNLTLPRGTLKRKFGLLAPPTPQVELSYPSPPMSSPPSPPRQSPTASATAGGHLATSTATSEASRPTLNRVPPPHSLASQPSLTVPTSIDRYADVTRSSALSGPPIAGLVRTALPQLKPESDAHLRSNVEHPLSEGLSDVRTERKSKAHVVSACINCKKAHLSCDTQRPCQRCVASGKQSTCVDVQHKKRGRPRLRDEGQFQFHHMVPDTSTRPSTASTISPTSSRPKATTRHQRTESLRSLRSHTSDELSPSNTAPPFGFAPQRQGRATQTAHSAWDSGRALSPEEIPTAFLDLDLRFIKANGPLQQILSNGLNLSGERLDRLVAPADNQAFEAILDHLREERDARDPNHLPPILTRGQDPIQDVSEANFDRFTQGYTDRTYTWRRNLIEPVSETFPARVRLGKASTYFAVVTLPSFRPFEHSIPTEALPIARPALQDPSGLQGRFPPQASTPTSSYQSWQAIDRPVPSMTPAHYSYPSLQPAAELEPRRPSISYEAHLAPFTPPGLPALEHRAAAPTGKSNLRLKDSLEPSMESPIRLAPIRDSTIAEPMGISSTYTASSPRSSQIAGGAGRERTEDPEGSPRKRQKLGIRDVLQ